MTKLWENHGEMVESLAKTDVEISAYQSNLVHACLGMCGESVEVVEAIEDKDAVLLEMGDFLFYYTFFDQKQSLVPEGSLDRINTHIKEVDTKRSTTGSAIALSLASSDLADLIKKSAINGKLMDKDKIEYHLGFIGYLFLSVCKKLGITLEQCREANIVKLSARYHTGKYSDEQAAAKADAGMSGTAG